MRWGGSGKSSAKVAGPLDDRGERSTASFTGPSRYSRARMVGLLFLRGSRGTTAFSLFVEVGSAADAERPLLVRLASCLLWMPFFMRPISRPTSKTRRDMLGLGSAVGQMRSNINKESEKMSEGSSASGIKSKRKCGSESPCHPRGGVGDEQRAKNN